MSCTPHVQWSCTIYNLSTILVYTGTKFQAIFCNLDMTVSAPVIWWLSQTGRSWCFSSELEQKLSVFHSFMLIWNSSATS